jgi:hypothetical protein
MGFFIFAAVQETESKAKYQQYLSGVSIAGYCML